MGLKQILMVSLSVIIVGIAIMVGIGIFSRQAMLAHRRDMLAQMNQFVVESIAYSKMPKSMGGGGGYVWGYMPSGAETYTAHIGAIANSGVRIQTNEVNYFIEWWAEGAYPQRLKIIASSKLYGEGNYWVNTYNARIIASYDAWGNLLFGSTNPNQNGIQITGDWKRR